MVDYYNTMKAFENELEQKEKEILYVAQKRTKLIANLTLLFSQLTHHETTMLNKITSNFSNLLAIANAYPTLMSNKGFMENYTQIEKLENEIQLKIESYNKLITEYNNNVTQFPNSLKSVLFGFKKKIYAEIT